MKRIMIFGASSGIGKMLAQKYAAEGNKVAVAARREEQLLELQKEYPSNILVCKADVASPAVEEGGGNLSAAVALSSENTVHAGAQSGMYV